MKTESPSIKLIWHSSLLFFVIAGLTGVLYRVGMVGGEVFSLNLQNIRHAHSHLMFFGWAGLLPLIIIYQYFKIGDIRAEFWMKISLLAIVTLSPVTYVFFLLWGYHPVSIGGADLPLAAMFSSLVMIAWYVFFYGYWQIRGKSNSDSEPWFTLALVMLMVSSLGAWGVGALQLFGVDNILLAKAMTHFFLGTFTEGWVVVIIIAILVKELGLNSESFLISPDRIRLMIVLGAPLTFSYGISESLLTPGLLWSARVGGLVASVAVIMVIFASTEKCSKLKALWFWPVILLGIKAITQLSVSVMPSNFWLADHNLRILYLHLLLLGAFTLTGFAFLHINFRTKLHSYQLMAITCMVLLFTLVLPTGLIPLSLKGSWIFYAMIFGAAFPVLAAIYKWILISTNRNI